MCDKMASSRRFFVGGNWKLNGNTASIKELVEKLNGAEIPTSNVVDIVVAPPALYLRQCTCALNERIEVSAQNCSKESKGAYTGENSPDMILDVGAKWTLIGHSERRTVFGEDDELIGAKVEKALDVGLKVIACIGETLQQRDANQTMDVVTRQMSFIAAKVKDVCLWDNVVIAYEPVWAIGTGRTASPEQAEEVHKDLRAWIASNVGPACIADKVRIIYGGSVTGDNCNELAKKANIDGFLVGGASLKPEFVKIINSATQQ